MLSIYAMICCFVPGTVNFLSVAQYPIPLQVAVPSPSMCEIHITDACFCYSLICYYIAPRCMEIPYGSILLLDT